VTSAPFSQHACAMSFPELPVPTTWPRWWAVSDVGRVNDTFSTLTDEVVISGDFGWQFGLVGKAGCLDDMLGSEYFCDIDFQDVATLWSASRGSELFYLGTRHSSPPLSSITDLRDRTPHS
jgi:hypothetical protein